MEPVRAPLVVLNTSRDETRGKGSWGVNEYGEELQSGLRASKRPGLISTVPTVGTLGQGLFNWSGFSRSIINDTLYTNSSLIPSSWAVWPFGQSDWPTVSFAPLGIPLADAWDSGTSYSAGDAVGQDGNTWYAVTSSTNVKPGSNSTAFPYWSRFAAKPVGTHPSYGLVTSSAGSYNDILVSGNFASWNAYLFSFGATTVTITGGAQGNDPSHGFGIGQVTYYSNAAQTYPNLQTGVSPGPYILFNMLSYLADLSRSTLV